MLLERMSVMMGGPEANGDSGQPGHRLDNAYELRRTKDAAKLLVPRREVSNADRAALLVGQNGRDDGGVAQIFRLEVDHADVGDVIADEHGMASCEWRVGHQLAHRGRLGHSRLFHLHDELSRQQFDRLVDAGGDYRCRLADKLLLLRSKTIVERERV